MSGIIDNRKRSREDDYNCDSTPLSKRINNLHLTNYEEAVARNSAAAAMPNAHSSTNHINAAHQHTQHSYQVHRQQQQQQQQQQSEQDNYNPELNETQNPYYFFKNKLLHNLHFERLKRHPI